MTAPNPTPSSLLTLQPDGAEPNRSRPHIVLVGLPGAGKSAIAPGLAQQLGYAFLDLDREIERRQSTTIAALFAEQGEHAFRALEVKVTGELKGLGGIVISPGGGWITNNEVVSLLRPPARLVYLKVRPETALKRLGGDVSARPLLSRPDPLAELTRLLEERKKLYESADVTVDTEHMTPEQLIEKLVKALGEGTSGAANRY